MRSLKRYAAALVILAAIVPSGCIPAPAYPKPTDNPPAAVISPKSTWKASGDLRNPSAAIDNDIATAASSGQNYNGASLTVDLGKPCVFNLVILDQGASEYAHPRRVSLLTSLDGQKFDLQWTAPGNRRVTVLCPLKGILARYVRVQAAMAGSQPWAIAELEVE